MERRGPRAPVLRRQVTEGVIAAIRKVASQVHTGVHPRVKDEERPTSSRVRLLSESLHRRRGRYFLLTGVDGFAHLAEHQHDVKRQSYCSVETSDDDR